MSDAEAWAVILSDYLGDPKPVVILMPSKGAALSVHEYRRTQTDLLPSLVVETYPAIFSPTLMKAVADARDVARRVKMPQFGLMTFEAGTFAGLIARELRAVGSAHN